MERDEDVRAPGHDDLDAFLFKNGSRSKRYIQRKVFLHSELPDSPVVVAAMARIEHYGRDRRQALDFVRTQPGFDCLGEVEAGNQQLAILDRNREIEPLIHPINFHLPAIWSDRYPVPAVIQSHSAAVAWMERNRFRIFRTGEVYCRLKFGFLRPRGRSRERGGSRPGRRDRSRRSALRRGRRRPGTLDLAASGEGGLPAVTEGPGTVRDGGLKPGDAADTPGAAGGGNP